MGSQFNHVVRHIAQMNFRFHELLEFLKLGRFVSLKDTYDEQQIKSFYCNAKREDDGRML